MSAIETMIAEAKRSRQLPPPALRRHIREQVGLSQEDIADALGVGRTAVTRWETGSREPGRAVRVAYVALLERLAEEVRQ